MAGSDSECSTPGYDVRRYKAEDETESLTEEILYLQQAEEKRTCERKCVSFLSYIFVFLLGVFASQYFLKIEPSISNEPPKPTKVNILRPPEKSAPIPQAIQQLTSTTSQSYFPDFLHLKPPAPRQKPDVSYKSTSQRSAICISMRSSERKRMAMTSLSDADAKVFILTFKAISLFDFRHGFREIENKYHVNLDITIPTLPNDAKVDEALTSLNFPSILILDHPVKRIASYYDQFIRFGGSTIPPERTTFWKEQSIDDWIEAAYVPEFKNVYTKVLSRICNSWDCELTKEDYISAVKILNSFDIVLISDWKRDPRIWGMMQGIFNLDFMQFHDNGFYKDLKATKPVTASSWGYTFGKITSMHPSLEKWLRKQNYWDHKLYRYAQRLLYTRIMLNADSKGIRYNFTYADYLERPEWSAENCIETSHPWERYSNFFEHASEVNAPFPHGYQNDGVPLGEIARDPGSKLNALQQCKAGASGIWMLHVHKAGGTILGRLSHDLSVEFEGSYKHPETNWGSFKHKVILQQIAGEFKQYITLTSLRNPIMRLLSRYDFEERWEGGQFGIPMNKTQMWSTRSFEQQAFNHFAERRYFNHAVKVLACRSWNCEIDQNLFTLAIKVLNSIDLTFIMEWYPDPRSSFMIHDVMSWHSDDLHFRRKTFPSATHKHKDKWFWDVGKIVAVHPDMWDWLHDHNWWEMQLWDYAKRLVWKRLQTINETNIRADGYRGYANLLKHPAWGPQIPET